MVVCYYEVTRGTSYMEEIWRDIEGYEGIYQISDFGNVKSVKFNKEVILKLVIDNGYSFVSLHKNGIQKKIRVHRLVAEAFIPNPNNYPIINHKDEIKSNNIVDNLEWCNQKYNNMYGTRISRVTNTVSKPIIQLTLDGNIIKEFKNTREIVECGYIRANVTACCKGKRLTHRGYIWKYKGGIING